MSVIQKDERRKYINLNPIPPSIRGLIKVHKEDSPIRPIVNWKNAPAYKLTKMLSKFAIYIPFPYTFNVNNTVHLMNDLLEIPYDQNLTFVSFGITSMYSNIGTNELTNIIDLMCNQRYTKEELKHEVMKISQILIKTTFSFKIRFTYACYGRANLIYIFWNIPTTHWKYRRYLIFY